MRLIIAFIILAIAVGHEFSPFYGWCVIAVGLIVSHFTKREVIE